METSQPAGHGALDLVKYATEKGMPEREVLINWSGALTPGEEQKN